MYALSKSASSTPIEVSEISREQASKSASTSRSASIWSTEEKGDPSKTCVPGQRGTRKTYGSALWNTRRHEQKQLGMEVPAILGANDMYALCPIPRMDCMFVI